MSLGNTNDKQMSKNRNRAFLNKAQNGHSYHVLLIKLLYPPYYDEGVSTYPKYKRGFKNPNKTIYSYQVRMYKNWKYNRKVQWKQKQ